MKGVKNIKALEVMVISTSPSAFGGIASVVNNYRRAGLIDGERVRLLTTHVEGGVLLKLVVMLNALVVLLFRLTTCPTLRLLHVHVASQASFYRKALFALVGKAFRRKVIFHVHSGHFPGFFEGSSRVGRRVILGVLRLVDEVVVLSPQWRDWMQTVTGRSDVRVIPNFVFPIARAAREGAYALYLGDFSDVKGVPDLVEAWVGSEQLRGSQLRLHGRGKGAARSLAALTENCQGSVLMGDWIAGEAKEDLIAGARVVVLPSYAEGAPMVILEAMSAGVPVVATKVGGIPDQVLDGVTGYLVEPGDVQSLARRLVELMSDESLRCRLGREGRIRFDRCFAPAVITSMWKALYWDQVGGFSGSDSSVCKE